MNSSLAKPTRAAPIGPLKGAPDKRQRGGRCHQCHDIGIVLHVVRQHGYDHLGLVAPAVDKQRTDRAVDQAGDQRLFFSRPAFALEVTAGDAARGIGLFLIIDGQGKEIDALAGRLGGDDGRQNDGLAIGGENSAVGLPRDFPGFQSEGTPTPVDLDGMLIEHGGLLS